MPGHRKLIVGTAISRIDKVELPVVGGVIKISELASRALFLFVHTTTHSFVLLCYKIGALTLGLHITSMVTS